MMVLHVIRRELAARWILLPASIVIGALAMIAIRSIGHVRGDADGIMNGTWVGTLVVSVIVGMSLLGEELSNSRLSFYFARPFSPHAIFGGKLFAGVLLALVMQIAIVVLIAVALPELSWRGSDLARRDVLSVGAERVLATIGCTLLGMAASIVFGSKTRWVVVDVLGVVAVGVVGTWFALRLEPDPAWLPENSIRSVGEKALFHSAAFAVVAFGLGIATARALVRGRTDRMRAHRTLSTTLWPIVVPAMVLLAFVGEKTVPAVPDPPALATLSVPEVRDGPIYERDETPMPYFLFVTKDSVRIGASASWAKFDRKLVRLSKPIPTNEVFGLFFNADFNEGADQSLDQFRGRRNEDTSGGLTVASVSLFDAKTDRLDEMRRSGELDIRRLAAYSGGWMARFVELRRSRIEAAIHIQTTELARAAGILGLVVDANNPFFPRRRSRMAFGVMQQKSNRRHRNELAVAAPTEMAKYLIDVVARTSASIAVSRGGHVRPLDIEFGGFREQWSDRRWIEVRIWSKKIVVKAMADDPIEVTDISHVGAALSAVQNSSRIDAGEPVDVLVGDDVDTQRLVDLLVALHNAHVRVIGVGHMPSLRELVLRDSHTPTIALSMSGGPNGNVSHDDHTIVRGSLPRILRCYNDGLAFKTFPPNTVSVTLAIDPNGKAALSAAGLVPGLANCVASVLETLEFPKRTASEAYRHILPMPSRYRVEIAFTP